MEAGVFLDGLAAHRHVRVTDCGAGVSAYNFTRQAFRKGLWDRYTMTARGLFARQGVIVGRGFDKFFALDQAGTGLDGLAFPVTATEKSDGFLASAFALDGRIRVWSKAGPTDYARAARRALDRRLSGTDRQRLHDLLADHDVSLALEIVLDDDPRLVRAPAADEATLLAVIANAPTQTLRPDLAGAVPLPRPRPLGAADDRAGLDRLVRTARDSHGEGAVLTDATGRMVKVKSDRYLALTRFRTAVTRVWQGTADHLPADMADVENALRRTRRWHRLPAYTATGPAGRPALDIPALLDGLPPRRSHIVRHPVGSALYTGMTGHTLHLADNQTILPALPDASIDTIMTDPPYGTGRDREYPDTYTPAAWQAMIEAFLRHAHRLLKPSGVCFTAVAAATLGYAQRIGDAIFTPAHRIATLTWTDRGQAGGRFTRGGTDYILVWARDRTRARPWSEPLPGVDDFMDTVRAAYQATGSDAQAAAAARAWARTHPDCPWAKEYRHSLRGVPARHVPLTARGHAYTYHVTAPDGRRLCPPGGWRCPQTTFTRLAAAGLIAWSGRHPRRILTLDPTKGTPPAPVIHRDRRHATDHPASLLGPVRFASPQDHR